jgi:O-antigen ligase
VVVTGLAFLYPRNPVAEKLKAAWPVAEHWSALSARNDVRSKAAMSVWQEHPWTGVGVGGFYHFAGLAVKPEEWKAVEKDRESVYNDGIQFLCEYGVFGAGLLFAALVILLVPVCYRARLMWQSKNCGQEPDRSFLLRLSPVVVTGVLATALCCLESFVASPFRSAALLLAWTSVVSSMPAFLPEKA